MCRVVMSPTVTVFSVPASESCIENAIVDLCFWGCADAWQGVGSIESKLDI